MAKNKVNVAQLQRRLLRRMIKDSRGRFIAITLIIMLGVMIFVGVKGIGPGYRDSAQSELNTSRLHDIEVVSTGGLTSRDVAAARKASGVTVQAQRSAFALAQSDESVVEVNAYANNRGLDRLMLRRGHLPREADQIVLDQRASEYGRFKLGDRYTFKKTSALKRRTYRIVGFVDSPRYINNTYDRGSANIGSGSVAYFAYLPSRNFSGSVYSRLAVRLNKRPAGDSFTSSYKDAVARKLTQVRRALRSRPEQRQTELVATASQPLQAERAKLDAAQEQLTAAQQQVAAASGGTVTTTPELTAQAKQLQAARAKLAAAQKQIAGKVNVQYTYNVRGDLQGFADFGASADRIAAIGDVFPVFFFLIAALITFTTISRMISEDRTQLGTMKALGFSRQQIARNYFIYALLAAVIGTILGVLGGLEGLTRFVLVISSQNIFTRQVVIPQWRDIALATGMGLIATIGAVFIVAPSELRVKPAELMLPKVPKNGQKILLERIRPLWRRLSFNAKVTLRNLFRFKSRMFMTVIGIAGGAGLILTGFGIRDSILGTAGAQFGPNGIGHYQAVVRLTTPGDDQSALHVLQDNDHYRTSTRVIYDISKVAANGHSVGNVSVIAPKQRTDFQKFVDLQRTSRGVQRELPQHGLLLSEKAAATLKVKRGDTIAVTNASGERRRIRVAGVVRNYVGHYAYMTAGTYAKTWGQTVANSLLVQTSHMSSQAQRRLSRRMLDKGGASNVTYTDASMDSMAGSMNAVVVILIVLSGLLSFVVLYNLTNINVSERMRELSTIKVLGFFDGEVTMYIVRENILLTLVGILCSFGVGDVLTRYILNQAASESVTFPFIIHWPGYVAAVVLTLAFTAIVMWITHRRLKSVDMLAALAARE
ncbi:ABC transporter permease [Lacticaseibacillus pabuli]|uniref:ABC transporter permease n=1 Tax=Lacticaseibacillus pabuli TaxID=3025672 RepID=A0ABY7WS22_9LACO|nr:ABC transporter permease [Lacticaseibacillus sp. KACC 23028]WDF82983.1 ABC transporter permease [Lacticaseibacillus sp. KACC 23028]